MGADGYLRHPTIAGDTVVFVSEDDLWTVPLAGGTARRLTTGQNENMRPVLSPDGRSLAYTSREDGMPEAYVMPAQGGPARRLTHLGMVFATVAWTSKNEVVLVSNAARAHPGETHLFAASLDGGLPRRLPWGPARSVSFGPKGGVVLGRHTLDIARWKRYRGGLTGDLWIDAEGKGRFRRLIDLKGNLATPVWVGRRVYFISDHEGIGNVYSVTPDGRDLRRHTDHEDFYARGLSGDGARCVYHCGADLYVLEPGAEHSRRIEVELSGFRAHTARRFVSAVRHLTDYQLRHDGKALTGVSRGRPFVMANWEGAVAMLGRESGVRYRLARFFPDGKRVLAVRDEPDGEEFLELCSLSGKAPAPIRSPLLGRPLSLEIAPKGERAAVINHRCELLMVDLAKKRVTVVDRSDIDRITGAAWSPDGRFLAYGVPVRSGASVIKILRLSNGRSQVITCDRYHNYGPAWDPKGQYLYFLSDRGFDPVYDHQYFDLNFPRGGKVMVVCLRKDQCSPFLPAPPEPTAAKEGDAEKKKPASKAPPPIRIDFAGIQDRVLAFPLPDGRYYQIAGLPGKLLYLSFPIQGALNSFFEESVRRGSLECWSFEDRKSETLTRGITGFSLSADAKFLAFRDEGTLRVVKAGEKVDEVGADGGYTPKSGWVDMRRVRIEVDPRAEWRQMLREAWCLQRDHFWTPDMSQVDWELVYRRYRPLVERVGTRAELSDLIWEMQGELGTSHAYEFGGDYRSGPFYAQGHLGADFAWDERAQGYRITGIVAGESWDVASPLGAPGAGIAQGDVLVAVAGRELSSAFTPDQALVNHAGHEIEVRFKSAGRRAVKRAVVKTLASEMPLRYRAWVNANRALVAKKTRGRVGYLHIPDMGPRGYSEFHKTYLHEVEKDALIVDARYNGGGHVSQLILEKLARRRLGYDKRRWGAAESYPAHARKGPLVCLINESTGSDGDIFAHCFKLMRLGPVIGKRTWGGVVGIHPRHHLVDGTLTTQPEFSFWFSDVAWNVENHGAAPDIEVEITPQDHAKGRDPQLQRGIVEIRRLLRHEPPLCPDFSRRPSRALPRLPRRGKSNGDD